MTIRVVHIAVQVQSQNFVENHFEVLFLSMYFAIQSALACV